MESFGDGPLVVFAEDDPEQYARVAQWLRDAGMRPVVCPDAETFIDNLELRPPDVVCMDLGLPGLSGRQALDVVRRRHPQVPVVMLTGDTSAETVVDAMRAGAFVCLPKPVGRDRLLEALRSALRASEERLHEPVDDSPEEVSYAGMVGRSPQMREVFHHVDRIAGRDISVLIRGESGTGKELIARAIHENSPRAGGPYIAINCAAIPESLQDSELFGHERGSFTGAHKARAGCFERADGGTLFLDEVGELSLGVQAKLLRVLQERRFDRVGGIRTVESDFRLVTATHRKLRDLVEAKKFREDLYFRIVVFEIEIPPLRARTGDVRLLVPRLLEDLVASLGAGPARVSEPAMSALERYPFPGNVRELQNILQSAAVLAVGDEIRLQDLAPRLREYALLASQLHASSETGGDLGDLDDPAVNGSRPVQGARPLRERPTPKSLEELPLGLEELERWAVKRALRGTDGRVTEAAKALGIGRTTLYRKLEKYGLR